MSTNVLGRALNEIVPARGPARRLALTQLAGRTGDGAYYVCAALFFTRIVGLSPAAMGVGLTIAWSVSLVLGVPLGTLADRRGPRQTAVWFSCCAGLGVGSYLFVRSFPLFLVGACLYAIGQRGGSAAQSALLAGVVSKEELARARAQISANYNAGLATGAGIGGVVLVFGDTAAYLAAFALNAAAFFVVAASLSRAPLVPPRKRQDGSVRDSGVWQDRPFVILSLLNVVLMLHVPLVDVALPLWVSRHTQAPVWVVSVMFILNTFAVVVCQVRVSQRVNNLAIARRYVLRCGPLLAGACVIYAFSGSTGAAWSAVLLLIGATAVQTVGEMIQMAGTWEISYGLVPAGRYGEYQAFFGSGLTVAELVGPVVLTSLLVYWGSPGWLLLGGLFVTAATSMVPVMRWAERRLAAAGLPTAEPA